jgi:hypothetical protein
MQSSTRNSASLSKNMAVYKTRRQRGIQDVHLLKRLRRAQQTRT